MSGTPSPDRTPARRLAIFAFAIVLVLVTGASVGYVSRGSSSHGSTNSDHGKATISTLHGAGDHAMKMDGASMQPMGLSASSNGLVLNLHSPNAVQTNASIEFSIVDASKRPVTDYTVEQTQKLHLILVRRDYTNYQHLHPTLNPDGTWSVHASFAAPGTYRLIADFTPTGKARTVLATNLAVDNQTTATPTSLPTTSNTTIVDGFTVTLASTDLAVGTENSLDETVTRNGKPVQLEQYLGSYGHAVLVRIPDFAYLHVHPASTDPVNGKVTFAATPTAAAKYVAFIQFQVAGKVHTAQFTLDAAGHGSSTATSTSMTGM